MEQDFTLRGIRQLCKHHLGEIIELHEHDMDSTESYRRKEHLNGLLNNRKIRFINPMGKFEYTKFGHFYFDENDVMMLITNEREYTLYHRPDILSHTLWSTVPVIFAGIDTRFKDDNNQQIFTGDIVTAIDMTSFVRYFHPTIPGLAGDNFEFQFEPGLKLHKEGTVFRDINISQFEHFDEFFFYWPSCQYVPNGISPEEIKRKAKEAWSQPTFMNPIKPLRTTRTIYGHFEEVLRDGYVIAYFRSLEEYEDDEGQKTYDYYIDDYPENFKGETYEIVVSDKVPCLERIKTGINSFFLYAHQHPKTKFVLCDFVRTLYIHQYLLDKTALLFYDWFTYNLTNVILPTWIFLKLCTYECIGRD